VSEDRFVKSFHVKRKSEPPYVGCYGRVECWRLVGRALNCSRALPPNLTSEPRPS
jgi:hypothetical protein